MLKAVMVGLLLMTMTVGGCDILPEKIQPVVTVGDIWVDPFQERGYHFLRRFALSVELRPTSSTVANESYMAELYEKGYLRDWHWVEWNQPELSVLREEIVYFSITWREYDAYAGRGISHIFSARVYSLGEWEELGGWDRYKDIKD